jgi:hypothetical protein
MSHTIDSLKIGSCIYCSSSDRLSDEHVVPYSLGGTLTLRAASCADCADITKRFEQVCARDMFGSFRAINLLPTRRKHQRPKELELLVEGPAGKQTLQVAVGDHPGVPVKLPILPPPGMRMNAPKQLIQADTVRWLGIAEINRTKAKMIVDSTNATQLSARSPRADLSAFMRLLAKIAHGTAHSMYHADGFVPFLPDYILGKDQHLPFVVGGVLEPAPKGATVHIGDPARHTRLGHTIGVGPVNAVDGRVALICHIQLFSFLPPAPVYEVFVANVPDRTKLVRRAMP